VVVGDLGTLLTGDPTSAAIWTPRASGTRDDLFGLACPSATVCVAVGAAGTIVTGDPTSVARWTARNSGTTLPLNELHLSWLT
jgi:hypothetical protein